MKSGKLDLIVAAACILLVVFALVLKDCACKAPQDEMANTVFKLVASEAEVHPGDEFQVDIVIDPAVDAQIAGAQFDLQFNPQSLEITSVQAGNFLSQGGASYYFSPGELDNPGGFLTKCFGVVTGPGSTLPNSGSFVVIQCRAKNAPYNSAFALDNVIVGNKDGVPVPLELITVDQVDVTLFGDVNNDGNIDTKDLNAIAAVFNETGDPGWDPADVNEDGEVNILDAINVGQLIV